jgi:hypothetical protein
MAWNGRSCRAVGSTIDKNKTFVHLYKIFPEYNYTKINFLS